MVINKEAFHMIRQEAHIRHGSAPGIRVFSVIWYTSSYLAAAVIMYLQKPCQCHGAGGKFSFSSSDAETGRVARWELLVTAVALSQVVWLWLRTTSLVKSRLLHGPDLQLEQGEATLPLDQLEWFYFVFFFLDMCLKLLAHQGFASYLKCMLNQFDFASTIAFFLNLFVFRLSMLLMANHCELAEKFKITYQIFFCMAMRKEGQAWTYQQEHSKLYEIFRKVCNANHSGSHAQEVRHSIRSALKIWHEQEDVLKTMSIAFSAAAENSTHASPDEQYTPDKMRKMADLARMESVRARQVQDNDDVKRDPKALALHANRTFVWR